eukprot:5206647-Prymnesium_polylepis.1
MDVLGMVTAQSVASYMLPAAKDIVMPSTFPELSPTPEAENQAGLWTLIYKDCSVITKCTTMMDGGIKKEAGRALRGKGGDAAEIRRGSGSVARRLAPATAVDTVPRADRPDAQGEWRRRLVDGEDGRRGSRRDVPVPQEWANLHRGGISGRYVLGECQVENARDHKGQAGAARLEDRRSTGGR